MCPKLYSVFQMATEWSTFATKKEDTEKLRCFCYREQWVGNGAFDWLIDRLIDWLINWLIDWVDWLIDCSIDWLIDWWFFRSIDWLIDWLVMGTFCNSSSFSRYHWNWCRTATGQLEPRDLYDNWMGPARLREIRWLREKMGRWNARERRRLGRWAYEGLNFFSFINVHRLAKSFQEFLLLL